MPRVQQSALLRELHLRLVRRRVSATPARRARSSRSASTAATSTASGLIWHVCRNLNLSGCTWLAPLEGGQCFSCCADPHAAERRRCGGGRELPRGRAGQAAPHRRARPTRLPRDREGCRDRRRSGERTVLRPALEHRPQRRHRARRRASSRSTSPRATRPIASACAASWTSRTARCSATSVTRSGTTTSGSSSRSPATPSGSRGAASSSATRRSTTRPRSTGTTPQGAPAGWELSYLTTYATMHPYEDFAETWAHFLHICDTIETASEYGLTAVAGVDAFSHFRDLVTGVWVPLSTALNMINRSMGKDDLYPFVIPVAGARQARVRRVAAGRAPRLSSGGFRRAGCRRR